MLDDRSVIPKPECSGILGGFRSQTTIWGDQPAGKGRYNFPRLLSWKSLKMNIHLNCLGIFN